MEDFEEYEPPKTYPEPERAPPGTVVVWVLGFAAVALACIIGYLITLTV